MFGLSSFSQAPFSSLVITSVDGWNEVTGDSNVWTQIDPSNVGFLVLSSSGTQYQVSYTVLGTQSYGVVIEVLNSSGTAFVPISESWQTASIGSNSWTEV
jgi:hypothetical protein